MWGLEMGLKMWKEVARKWNKGRGQRTKEERRHLAINLYIETVANRLAWPVFAGYIDTVSMAVRDQ